MAVMERIKAANVTLNPKKCEFSKPQVKFLGHLIDVNGIQADPEKTAAISSMKPPRNITELHRFLGMANQLGKFSPHPAEYSQPLRELLHSKRVWVWGPEQEQAFQSKKKPTVLAMYDPAAETKVSADASSFGLGAVMLQKAGNEWRPVAYASRSMTDTERRYAQIEKEALAVTWACEKFRNYLLGQQFHIESDHKPLIPLLNSKHLDTLPPRVLRFRLRMATFDYTVQHVPGKLLYTADTLSRAPNSESGEGCILLQKEVETFISSVTSTLPASKLRLEEYRKCQGQVSVCSKVREYCQNRLAKKVFTAPDSLTLLGC